MNHQHPQILKAALLLVQILEHGQRRAAGAHALSVAIRNDRKLRLRRQESRPLLDLLAESLRLLRIGRR